MNFEQQPTSAEGYPSELNISEQIIKARGLAGPSLDFSRVQAEKRREVLAQNAKARELYDEVMSIIDTKEYPMIGSNPDDVMDAIGILAEKKGWKDYDVNFDDIREELQMQGIPLLAQKTKADL